jgi:hypothetical protein
MTNTELYVIPGKEPVIDNRRGADGDSSDETADGDSSDETADARQEDDRVAIDTVSVIRDDGPEHSVPLSPRISRKSYTADAGISLCETPPAEVCTSTPFKASFKDFLRQNPCPAILNNSASPIQRENPPLLRSLAWSQDSQDEKRLAKRRRGEDNYTASWPKHRRQDSSSPTRVHWEEKIAGPMDLTNAIQRAYKITDF